MSTTDYPIVKRINMAIEGQICFPSDGYMFCNFVIKNGVKIEYADRWIRFPLNRENTKSSPKKDEEEAENRRSS